VTQPSQASGVKRVPDMDLGEIFGNRTNGLAGLSPRRRQPQPITDLQQDVPTAAQPQTPVQVEPPAPIEEIKPVAQSTQPAVAPRKRVHRPRTTMAADADAAALRLVIVQLPNAIADRLRDQARTRSVTYKELILDAVEATVEQLGDLVAQRRPRAREVGSLFAGERTTPLVRPEGRRQISIKLTEASITAVDNLATTLGAKSRSELIAIALDAYLPEE
jgi:Ribbon-helix-helix protein, copG family